MHQHPFDGEIGVASLPRSPSGSGPGWQYRGVGLGSLTIHLRGSLRTSLLVGGSPLLVQETVIVRRWAFFRCPSPKLVSACGGLFSFGGEETTGVLLTGGG